MKWMAAPMVGGMISSTILTLVVIPAVYALVHERGLSESAASSASQPGDLVGELRFSGDS